MPMVTSRLHVDLCTEVEASDNEPLQSVLFGSQESKCVLIVPTHGLAETLKNLKACVGQGRMS